MKLNYDAEMQAELEKLGIQRPRLLLHACCAPCTSSVLERLAAHFAPTVYYYNPNIYPPEEYERRWQVFSVLLAANGMAGRVGLLRGEEDAAAFAAAVRGLEGEPEGGARCTACFRLRLEKTAQLAAREGYDYFTTTLTVSPHKDAQRINEIGRALGEAYGVRWLPSDFKKRDGYLRSIRLSAAYGLYRQDYCGCAYSIRS